jgi:hypothetical protein
MDDARSLQVLFVYYTFTKRAPRVTQDMESVFVTEAGARASRNRVHRSSLPLVSSGSRSSIGI